MFKKNVILFTAIFTACISSAYAAKAVDLKNQYPTFLQLYAKSGNSGNGYNEVSTAVDFNHTKHIRVRQTYAGVPVWGADAVIHIPNGKGLQQSTSQNGTFYQELEKDLGAKPLLNQDKVLNYVIQHFQTTGNSDAIIKKSIQPIIYIDKQNRAQWAYLVSLLTDPAEGLPVKPTLIINAKTFEIYQQWNNIQTEEAAIGGGFGGNKKTGQIVYDGLQGHFPKLNIMRNADQGVCYLKNDEVTIKNRRDKDAVSNFSCTDTNAEHDNVWWSGDFDTINGAYSPGNDALYIGSVIQDMYTKWYGIPALADSNGKKQMLNMRIHARINNAFWDGEQMTFGDGRTRFSMFYPLVSLGVGAHEVSHGFTEQHSGLQYDNQSGGLNESFSDMAAQAAEYYSVGQNTWQIGAEIVKANMALRYMDQPSKDCKGKQPGDGCSIDNASQYKDGLNVHFSSGVFNRAFYLMATSSGWNTRKAFNVMVQANLHYWTSTTSWVDAACGVLTATKDYKYDVASVTKAFSSVGIDTASCKK